MASGLIACGDFMFLRMVIEAGGGEWRKGAALAGLYFHGCPVVEDDNLAGDEIIVGYKRRRPYTYDDIVDLLREGGA
jgi:hypothetical protein